MTVKKRSPLFLPALLFLNTFFIILILAIAQIIAGNYLFNENSQKLSNAFKNGFIENQKSIIRDETLQMALRIERAKEKSKLLKGVSLDEIKEYMLNQLNDDRYGIENYGYFYVIENGVIRVSPEVKEIIGKKIHDIQTFSGENFGQIIDNALIHKNSAYTSYFWRNPESKNIESKTVFLLKIPEWNWIIGTGFYLSHFDQDLNRGKNLILNPIRASMSNLSILLLFVAIISLFITFLLGLRTYKIEVDKTKYTLLLEQYKTVLDATSMVSRTDLEGRITYVNDKFCEVSGYDSKEIIGQLHNKVRHPDTPKEIFRELWSTIQNGNTWQGILKNKKADGSSYIKTATIIPLKDEKNRIIEYISSGQDITELVEQRKKLENIFRTDELTGLGNRIKLLHDLEEVKTPHLALFNIDRFSEINSVYGHLKGDQILIALGAKIFQALNSQSFSFYRINADTFAVLTNNVTGEDFFERMQKIHSFISNKIYMIDTEEIPVSLRVGVADESKEVLLFADIALQTAKSKKLPIYHYNKEENQTKIYKHNIEILKSIRYALDKDLIFPLFQPIKNLKTEKIEKYECLMRIQNEAGEIMSPESFIDISKKTRLYPKLTLSMIEKCVQTFKTFSCDFSINLSLEDLMNPETIDFLLTYVKENNVLSHLVVEILETEELTNFDYATQILNNFQNKGAKIAIDDFGSGYSNFNYLLKLNPNFIKIDSGIIRHIFEDDRAMKMLKSIITFAQDSGMKTVAEYIESEQIYECVKQLGVDYGQGYFIGKPEKL